ncbi:coiled-coil domain-containing protein [Priestia megaterium]|uniref:Secreted cell wall DL-endopeptidase n=1 Tax=Priestia megaterium (strain DSM 319 / IMG 1521) TaxID=592022 RepID=D5DEM4_PRIM3|nr:C40 family peptidase [Priestia megaterium]ADF39306.1 secreted cell wall DL-endopeptidase [Priestia megaterium DSM 319]MED4217974.1 NlpC/P60 family protein [Priestia megaterium]WEZ38466.1 NlpC/P60 family protein [Priestia megaterium DSM 319]
MKKKMLLLNTTVLLGLGGILSTPAYASTIQDMESQKSQIQNQRQDVQSNIKAASDELTRLQAEQDQMKAQLERLTIAEEENNKKAQKTEADIKETSKQVEQLEKEIKLLQEKLEKRNDILKDRARSLQESGGNVEYLQVLLGSSSFGDFVDRALAVSTIVDADRGILKETKNMQDELKTKQADVKSKLASLEDMKAELDEMTVQLAAQKKQKDALAKELKDKEVKNEELKASLQSKDSSLANEQSTLEQNIKDQKATEEAARKAAKEAAKKAAEQAQKAAAAPAEQADSSSAKAETPKASSNDVAPTSAPAPKASNVVTVGNRWVGNSAYVFGGGRSQSDISHGLFDCSSFVHWAYSQVGVNLGPLGSVSTETLKHAGTQVSSSQMQPGDLVFFDTYKKDGHVGIYVGGGKFIGAQSSTGVAIANMSSGYWKQKFNGRVVRI